SYAYGASGNRQSQTVDGVTTTYTYNALNQLLSETSPGKTVTHTYDDLGNELSRVTAVSGQPTTTESFEYNHQNLMSTYANNQTGATWQYDYWPGGERYAKTDLSTFTSEVYIPRDGDVVNDYNKVGGGTPTLKNTYVQGLGMDTKTMRISGSSRRFYLGDMVGTVGATMDDTGALVETTVRDGWGQTIAGSTAERYGFAQRELDLESGLVYMRHRMYDSRTGRFYQIDPVVENRHSEHYAYASNSPAMFSDPMGLWKIDRDSSYDWAIAEAEPEKGDTDISLAALLQLNHGEIADWLREAAPSDSEPRASGAKHRKVTNTHMVGRTKTKYLIPNTILKIYGKNDSGIAQHGLDITAIDNWVEHNVSVTYGDRTNERDLYNL